MNRLCQNSDLSLMEVLLNRKGRRGFRRGTQRKAFLSGPLRKTLRPLRFRPDLRSRILVLTQPLNRWAIIHRSPMPFSIIFTKV